MKDRKLMENTRQAAVAVLLHNNHGPCLGLPRTAAWGYPEPYTRDLLISALGILCSEDATLINALRRVLVTVAANQSRLGHIPSLIHDPDDRGASDTTPLFLMTVAIFRRFTGERDFLASAVQKALQWMEYQSPADNVMVGQLPTSDWRDEQWVLGYGLYVNTLVYGYLQLLGEDERAEILSGAMKLHAVTAERQHRHVHEGLSLRKKPYYALWSYKILRSERVDLLGNSLAILTRLASASRARAIIKWIESECAAMRARNELAVDLPPCLFPYIQPEDPDWHWRYQTYNRPGIYHNGGIWPFICGFYIAAAVAAGRHALAEAKLEVLTELVNRPRNNDLAAGFNEWYSPGDGTAQGQDWQSWSAAMYLYACACVEQKKTPFFDILQHRE